MKLIYLLCGATSARIGQVLNLTINDINFTSLQVRLISPHSDEVDDYGHSRKIWLFNKYNIDMDSNNEHNQPDLQFKYRIPAHHTYLYWLDENKYKNLFFETLEIYLKKNYIDINDRTQKHPFFFTTKSSKRYRGNYAYNTFKRHCEVLAQKHEGYKLQLENLKGTHSLRHMFGRVLAEYAIKTNNQNILMLVAEAMGHENIFSTLEYFKPGDNAIKEAFRKVLEPFDSTQPINDNDIKMCLTAALKLKNTHRSSTV